MLIFQSGVKEWHIIFAIGATIYIACGAIFCIFGSGEQQWWNNPKKIKQDPEGVENPAYDSTTETSKPVSIIPVENTKV